jgi:hypothetical protein
MTSTQPKNKERLETELKALVASRLNEQRLQKLRNIYAKGTLTIVALSKLTDVPPVLTYSAVTPVRLQTKYKIKSLKVENNIERLLRQSVSALAIKTELKLPLATILLFTKNKFSTYAEVKRGWYSLKYRFREEELDVFEFREETLPPAVKLGMNDSLSSDAENVHRCGRCGTLNYIPDEFTLCLACRTRLILETHQFPELPPDMSEEESDPFRLQNRNHDQQSIFRDETQTHQKVSVV